MFFPTVCSYFHCIVVWIHSIRILVQMSFLKLKMLAYFFCCSYIVPEYSFLDARGLGAYEGKSLESVSEVLTYFSPPELPY